MNQITHVVKHLLVINILMFVVTELIFPSWKGSLAMYYPGSEQFQPIQLVTHFFMHGGWMHLFFNMYALAMFGPPVEMLYRSKRFLFYYIVCALGAAVLHNLYTWYDVSQLQTAMEAFQAAPSYDHYWQFFNQINPKHFTLYGNELVDDISRQLLNGDTGQAGSALQLMNELVERKMNVPAVGASGAIYGLLLAFGMQFPNHQLMLIFFPVPIKAKYFIPLLMVAEFYFGLQGFDWDPIAHFAHLGGALAGFIMIMIWRKTGARLY